MNEIFSMAPTRLDERPRKIILRNAMYLLKAKYRRYPARVLVAALTGFGCTNSIEVCLELGIDPDQPFKEFSRE
jgi:hypothetical protein